MGQRSRMQRHQWFSFQSCPCPATPPQWLYWATTTSLSCSPGVPCLPKGGTIKSLLPAFICLGERNSLSQLGHLHLLGCQAPEDCSSPENIFPDIFWGCTIYSVVQSHEICRAFHGNHGSSFLLKETAKNRKQELYQDKTNLFKDTKEIHQNKSCSQECSSVPMRNRTVETVTVLDALWNKAKRAGGAEQKRVQFVPHLSVPLLATPSWACPSSLTDTLGSGFQVHSH